MWKEDPLRLCELNALDKAPLEAQMQEYRGRVSVPVQYLRESEKASMPYLEIQ